MSNNRIVILSQYFHPEMGAPQTRLLETVRGLIKRGWDVEVITSMPNYPTGKIFSKYRGKFRTWEKVDSISVLRLWLIASNSKNAVPRVVSMVSFSLMSLTAFIYLWQKRPKYLLVESPPLLLGLSGWILARLSGALLLLNISDLWPLSAVELGALNRNGSIYSVLKSIELFLYKNAYACMGQSQEIVDHLKKNGAQREWLYRNGVDVDRFSVSNIFKHQRPLRMVYAGLMGVAQGILELCKTLDPDPNMIEIHLYGDGTERKAIEEYLKSSGKRVFFLHDSINRDLVPDMLKAHDLTLIPLKRPIYGAVPSKIYEAMAAGLPILFAGGGEGAMIIERYDLGWICSPGDYRTMQKQIEEISRMSEMELKRIRMNGLSAARDVFSREIQLDHLHAKLMSTH